MFYREIAPAPHLNQFIVSFWEFLLSPETSTTMTHEIFPDGCVSLFYYTNPALGIARLGVTPLFTETTKRTVTPGDRFWGMRISPAACGTVLGVDPVMMREPRYFPASEFPLLANGVADAIANADSLEHAIRVFQSKMETIAGSGIRPDSHVAKVVDLLVANAGDIRISDLASTVSLSPRQLQRRFKAASGLTMKRFARIRRIRQAAFALIEQDRVNWADRAAEMGYADQAHLTREFSSVTNQTPGKFARKLRTIKHGPMVK